MQALECTRFLWIGFEKFSYLFVVLDIVAEINYFIWTSQRLIYVYGELKLILFHKKWGKQNVKEPRGKVVGGRFSSTEVILRWVTLPTSSFLAKIYLDGFEWHKRVC